MQKDQLEEIVKMKVCIDSNPTFASLKPNYLEALGSFAVWEKMRASFPEGQNQENSEGCRARDLLGLTGGWVTVQTGPREVSEEEAMLPRTAEKPDPFFTELSGLFDCDPTFTYAEYGFLTIHSEVTFVVKAEGRLEAYLHVAFLDFLFPGCNIALSQEPNHTPKDAYWVTSNLDTIAPELIGATKPFATNLILVTRPHSQEESRHPALRDTPSKIFALRQLYSKIVLNRRVQEKPLLWQTQIRRVSVRCASAQALDWIDKNSLFQDAMPFYYISGDHAQSQLVLDFTPSNQDIQQDLAATEPGAPTVIRFKKEEQRVDQDTKLIEEGNQAPETQLLRLSVSKCAFGSLLDLKVASSYQERGRKVSEGRVDAAIESMLREQV
jgi:hypothetical protein